MGDLTGFPKELLRNFGFEECVETLADALRDYAKSQFFHINDMPKPIRRAFYRKMKEVPDKSCVNRDKVKPRQRFPGRGSVLSNVSDKKSVSASKRSADANVEDRPLRKITSKVRVKSAESIQESRSPVNKDGILSTFSVHSFSKDKQWFRAVEVFDKPPKDIETCSIEGAYIKKSDFHAHDVKYVIIPLGKGMGAMIPDQHDFWYNVFGLRRDSMNVARAKEKRVEINRAIHRHVLVDDVKHFSVIVKRDVGCKKAYADLLLVKDGVYSDEEVPRLFVE